MPHPATAEAPRETDAIAAIGEQARVDLLAIGPHGLRAGWPGMMAGFQLSPAKPKIEGVKAVFAVDNCRPG